MLQICKVCFIQAIRTIFISNKQKYTRSTHAVESMYSNIKNKQTFTYMYLLKNLTVPQKGSLQQKMSSWIRSVNLMY